MPERPAWRQLPNAFSLLLLVLLAANYFVPFADLDFAWHIRSGERILQTGQLRPPEAFTYTIAGSRETVFEGLYEITLFVIWKCFGFGGLKLLKTILVAAPLLILGLRLRKEGLRWHGIALALLLAIFVLSSVWNLRPLYCTTIGLLLVSGWLHDHCHGRRPLTCWLPLVMFLWANVHPGVIMGQALLVGAISWEWLNRWLKLNPPLERRACWRLTAIGVAGLAATLVGPNPLERLLFPFRPEVAHPIQRIFVEMQPAYVFLLRPPFGIVLVYLVALLVGITVLLRFRHYRAWELALLLGLTALANLAVRSLQDWLLVMLVLGLPHLAVLLRQAGAYVRNQKRNRVGASALAGSIAFSFCSVVLRLDRFCKRMMNGRLLRFQWSWPAAGFAALAIVSLIPSLSRDMPIQEAAEWPRPAVDWIEAQGLEGRFFAVPDYGSYLTWRLGERTKCYVSCRGFSFPPELLEDSHYVPQLGPDWRARLERIFAYQTDYFLLETTGPRGQLWQALQAHISQPLYCDGRTVLLSTSQVRSAMAQFPVSSPILVSTSDRPCASPD